uniref:Uncharacterized protein n=1 Tax=Oryza glumipatula TaxID=40148 RepID=A0A0D9ZUT4_9ORYZ
MGCTCCRGSRAWRKGGGAGNGGRGAGKKPARVWGSFLRWSGSEMRPRHRLDTHLHRQIDLAGRRERMSMMSHS